MGAGERLTSISWLNGWKGTEERSHLSRPSQETQDFYQGNWNIELSVSVVEGHQSVFHSSRRTLSSVEQNRETLDWVSGRFLFNNNIT